MSRKKQLVLGKGLRLPAEAALQRWGILAMSGAGKSNTAVVFAEELYDAGVPWVAIDPKGDWWGVRSSADGKGPGLKVPVFGGLHGDVPLEPTAGKLMAELIASQRMTCVLDVSEFDSKAEQLRFLTDFAETLLKKNRDPLMLICEEADDYLPQRVMANEARCVGAWTKIIKRGRFRGIFSMIISQRSAALSKDALNQTDTLVPMRVTAPLDRKAIEGWVVQNQVGKELIDSLAGLDDGEAWVMSPQKLKRVERVEFRRRRTFDSGETPTLRGTRRAAKLADVDLGAIKESMAKTIERAEAEDPTKLRKQVAGLKREVAKLEKKLADRPEPAPSKPVEVPVLRKGEAKEARRAAKELVAATKPMSDVANTLQDLGSSLGKAADQIVAELDRANGSGAPSAKTFPKRAYADAPKAMAKKLAGPHPYPTTASPERRAPDPELVADDDEKPLKAGARRMLEMLARLDPTPLTRVQLGTLSDISPKSGTFSDYLGKIKKRGLATEADGTVLLTEEGTEMMKEHLGSPAPTVEELTDMWSVKFKAGARRMLDHLVAIYPETCTRDELAQAVEIERSSGTFSDYLGKLKKNTVAVEEGGQISAGPALFIGEGR